METPTIHQLLQDLHDVTGLAVHLYDAQERGLIHFGNYMGLCALLHVSDEAYKTCHNFDAQCFREAAARDDVYVQSCPFGIYTAICPIRDTGKLLGFLQLDSVLCDTPESEQNARELSLAYLPEEDARILQRMASIVRVPEGRLAAIPTILRTVCGYIEANSLFPVGDISLGVLIKRYVKHNLLSPLTLADIAASLHCSKATLTETFRREFGITIVQYIHTLRLTKARHMLLNTELPIGTVAEECGFSGAEYFSSLFKKEVGLSPLLYRKKGGEDLAK